MKQLAWYDRLQLAAMLLMAAAVPVSWQLGLWVAVALAGVSFVKLVARRRIGNPALGRGGRWSLGAMLIYWLVMAASSLYSSNTDTAWIVLGHKAVLLIFPLCFLLTDTSYLTRRHLRWVGCALLTAMVGVALFCTVRAGVAVGRGTSLATALGDGRFDTRHHAYCALYAVVALVYVYTELSQHWSTLRGWQRGLLMATVPLLMAYVLIVNSRAGVVAMLLLVVCAVLHQAIGYRRWVVALVALLLVAGGTFAVTRLPGHQNRVSQTIDKLQKDNQDDARINITRIAWQTAGQRLLTGYGVGDYADVLVAQYEANDYQAATQERFNAHNQYMESLLAAGVAGLVALLAMLFLPLLLAWRSRSAAFTVFLLTAVVAFNLIFESMLERQMGLLFIGFLVAIMPLILNAEENKFGRMGKY